MASYTVEYAHWVAGSGYSYNTSIDNIETLLSAEQLQDAYEDYCQNEGDEIRLVDNSTNEVVALFEK